MEQPTSVRRLPSRPVLIGSAAAALLVIGALAWVLWPSGPKGLADLAKADPHGAKACEALADWLTGDMEGSIDDMRAVTGPDAYAASTAGIKATVVDITEGTVFAASPIYLSRVESLYPACEAAGVDMPDRDGRF